MLAEPTVLESVGVGGLVLLPQQKQGYAFAFELAVHLGPIRLTTLGTGHRWPRRVQRSFECFIVERCRPAHTGQSRTGQVIPQRALSDPASSRSSPSFGLPGRAQHASPWTAPSAR